jgi:hypothetical protein
MDLDLVETPNSPRRTFADLAEFACPGVDRDALLDELLAAGSVEIVDGTTVRCLTRSYVPRGGDVNRIERMGRFLAAASGNFVHNLLRAENEPSFFERTVVSDHMLDEQGRDRFLAMAAERGEELTTDLDTWLAGLASADESKPAKKYGVSVYFFEEEGFGHPDAKARTTGEPSLNDEKKASGDEIDVLDPARRK